MGSVNTWGKENILSIYKNTRSYIADSKSHYD